MADKILKCPVCGGAASAIHLAGDGMDFGWMCGCNRFCINDGIHGVTDDDPPEKRLMVQGYSRQAVVAAWNTKVVNWNAKG